MTMPALFGVRLPRGPIPLRVETMRCAFDDALDVRVLAQKDGAIGISQVFVSRTVAYTAGPSAYTDLVERVVASAADRALDMWLLDHETQQGWPPRDCLHGPET